MEQDHDNPSSKRRLQKRSGKMILFPLFLALLCVIAIVYLLFPESIRQFRPAVSPVPEQEQSAPSAADTPSAPASQAAGQANAGKVSSGGTAAQSEEGQTGSAEPGAVTESPVAGSDDGFRPSASGDRDPGQTPQLLADNIEQFFDTLDSRPYIHDFDLDAKSSVYFPQLIQRLIDNPPVVTGETDDLFTILQNTAHFFRIIGKKNILVLKGILDREKDTFEKTLADFYALTSYPDQLQERFRLRIGAEPLYQYAGFFLNTMGGRLYLFRRDSMSRMVVNYYAILVIDQANREGRNKYGIQLDTAIDSLIGEIESSSANLKMRDTYLDALYALKEKYQ